MNTSVEAFAPATVANVGIGFDILGLAVAGAGDVVRAEYRDEQGAILTGIEGDGGKLSHKPDENIATIAANALLKQLGVTHGVSLFLKKGLPLGSGLGSSAASAVAAVVAVNALLGEPLTRAELLPAALEGEAFAAGGYHADNVAPCLFGGITLSNGIEAQHIQRLPVPDKLQLALVTPNVSVPTSEARRVLPQMIPLKSMIRHTGAVAALVSALYRGDVEAMAAMMEKDEVIEPARAHLMPLLHEMRFEAKRHGALALVISGAGPTLCAVCDNPITAQAVGEVMQALYVAHGLSALVRVSGVATDGADVLIV